MVTNIATLWSRRRRCAQQVLDVLLNTARMCCTSAGYVSKALNLFWKRRMNCNLQYCRKCLNTVNIGQGSGLLHKRRICSKSPVCDAQAPDLMYKRWVHYISFRHAALAPVVLRKLRMCCISTEFVSWAPDVLQEKSGVAASRLLRSVYINVNAGRTSKYLYEKLILIGFQKSVASTIRGFNEKLEVKTGFLKSL